MNEISMRTGWLSRESYLGLLYKKLLSGVNHEITIMPWVIIEQRSEIRCRTKKAGRS